MNSAKGFLDEDNKDESAIEEIDLKNLVNIFKRNIKLIISFGILGVTFGIINAYSTKNTWQGEFQIVLDKSQKSLPIDISPRLTQLANFNSKNELATEVGILKSPSVLMKIFEYVKKEKQKYQGKEIDLNYTQWQKGSLDISLQKRTSILDIAYRDTNKDLIIPVLQKLSKEYQNYSGKKRLNRIELGISYFEDQIQIYQDKSKNSLNKVQNFATEHNLALEKNVVDPKLPNSTNIEVLRLKAVNEITAIDSQIQKIKDLDENNEKLMYISSTIPDARAQEYSKKLKELDSELARLRSIYLEDDKSIRLIKREKIYLNKLLKRQLMGYLLAKKESANANRLASERPDGVLIEFKELLNQSQKDQFTLNDLQDNVRALYLEKARIQEPWELITEPTLLSGRVAPRRKRIMLLSIVLGTIIGYLIALIKERISNIIFTESDALSLANSKLIAKITYKDNELPTEYFNLISKGILSKIENKLNFIVIGKIGEKDINNLTNNLNYSFSEKKINVLKNINFEDKEKNFILVVKLRVTKSKELEEIIEKLKLLDRKPLGVLLID